MTLDDLGPRQALALFAAAALLGWFAAPPEAPPAELVQARRDAWQLASLPMAGDATARAVLVSSSPIWGPEAKPDAAVLQKPPENLRWRLAGVFGAGKVGGALVLFDDPAKPPQRLKVGEKLPSGHAIEAVDGNQVCIRIGKKLYRFGVEQRD